jgi:hypothetical protein
MIRSLRLTLVLVGGALLVQQASAQESKAAKATREKLKQVIAEFEGKDIGAKAFFEDINRELDKSINFKIDNTTGISNNTKLTFKAKKITVEKLLNDLSDRYEFGWVVISNPGNNKVDGWVIIRKSDKGKERGYEAGKKPQGEKQSRLPLPRWHVVAVERLTRRHEAVFVSIGDRWR